MVVSTLAIIWSLVGLLCGLVSWVLVPPIHAQLVLVLKSRDLLFLVPLLRVSANVLHVALQEAALSLFLIAALTSFKRGVWILGKDRTTGELAPWSFVVFWLYHTLIRVWIYLLSPVLHPSRMASSPIPVPQGTLLLGAWRMFEASPPPKQIDLIVDLTAEFPRYYGLDNSRLVYLNLPTWDTTAPDLPAVTQAVTVLRQALQRGQTAVVHCAHGRGRSTVVVCALLLDLGVCDAPAAAEAYVRKCRPEVALNADCKRSLAHWWSVHQHKSN